ncbi:MAG TPA: ATP-dependent helicase [Thermococcus sp.]|nr:ATP-dependent helicase [Thermococcus sp.]
MIKMKTVVKGIPGSGKTTFCLNLVVERDPRRTIYISYSRKAIHEARKRAMEKYGLESSEIKWFRTIHSLCYRALGYSREDILTEDKIKEFFDKWGLPYAISGRWERVLEEGYFSKVQQVEEIPDGNKILALRSYLIHKEKKRISDIRNLEAKVSDFISKFGNFDDERLDIPTVVEILKDYERFKGDKIDYEDVLLEFLERGSIEDVDVLIVDEFQDLTPLMYEIVKKLERVTKEQFYVGDEAQSIYEYLSASPEFLIREFENADKKVILGKSYRLPDNILKYAMDFLRRNCKKIISSEFEGSGRNGRIERVFYLDVKLLKRLESIDTHILFRTNRQKREFKKFLIENGIFFREMGMGKRIWTPTAIKIYKFLIKLKKREKIPREFLSVLELVPYEPFLHRGIKAKIKKGKIFMLKDEITLEDLKRLFRKPEVLEDPQRLLDALMIEVELKDVIRRKFVLNPTEIDEKNCIWVGTIHSDKGGEARVVIVHLELPKIIKRRLIENMENEARVFYVALTRAKEWLILVGENDLTWI